MKRAKYYAICSILALAFAILMLSACRAGVDYTILPSSFGAPVVEDEELNLSRICVYRTEQQYREGTALYKSDGTTNEADIDFKSQLVIHAVIYHTSSDSVDLKSVTKEDDTVSINISVKIPSSGRAEDEIFTHTDLYFP